MREKDLQMEMLKRQLSESQQQSRVTTPAASTRDAGNIRTVGPQYPVTDEPRTSTATRLELADLKAKHAEVLAAEDLRNGK